MKEEKSEEVEKSEIEEILEDKTVIGAIRAAVTGGEIQQKMYAQFNKINGKPVSLIATDNPEYLDHEKYEYVECYGCPYTDRLIGTIDDFTLLPEEEGDMIITERMLNEQAIDRVVKQYKLIDQVNILRNMVIKLCEAAGESVTDSEEFSALFEMHDYIDEILRVNKTKKDYYANAEGFEYVSNERQEKEFDESLEGGIRDTLGPRESGSTERIF